MRPVAATTSATLSAAGLAPPLGGETDTATAHERKLRRAEAHVAWMRDVVAAFVWLTVPWLFGRPAIDQAPFLGLLLGGTLYVALAHVAYRREWSSLERRAAATSLTDAAIILAMIAVTGGWTSPLTPLLYVSMAAVAYRYELAYGLAFGAAYGLAYAGTVYAVGPPGPTVDLVLRVGLLVATGLLASLSSKSYLEAEVERSRARHAFEDILETVPGDVALIRREDAFPEGGPDEAHLPRREPVVAALPGWMPADAVQRTREALTRVFADAETVEHEVSATDDEDRTSTYRTIAGPLLEDGTVRAAVLISTDVTERKRAQRRLQDHARALRQSNQALARYASLTAHDLREPLRDIVRYLQRIERSNTDLDRRSREELRFVIQRARRLDSLVRALHRFAEVDERLFRTERVDLEEALATALERVELTGPTRLDVQAGDLDTVTADRRAVVEILVQLLDNAHQHGGRETVHVWVESERTDGGWIVTVEDDGRGIPRRYHEQIFEPFRPRDPDAGSQQARMGLATVRRLVERLGGDIEVDSEPGAGTRFRFTVPRRSVLAETDAGRLETRGLPGRELEPT